ncbi:hypothetical protein BH11PSE4_BH11PSE4_07290 [soil metagenome]
MKTLITAAVAAAMTLLPVLGNAEPMKKPRKVHHRAARVAPPPPATYPLGYTGGNAAMEGNNAASAYGSNSAGENANGRSSGGSGFGN